MTRRLLLALPLASACFTDHGLAGAAATSVDASTTDPPPATTSTSTAAATTDATADATAGLTTTGDAPDPSTGDEAGSSSSTGAPPDPLGCPPGLDPCPNFPGATWDERDPAELGCDGDALAQFAVATGGDRGCVVRWGYLAGCWGDPTLELEWASASKPVWSMLLLFAVAEGLLDGVDHPIADFAWPLEGPDGAITFRDLANQISGYGLPEGPGSAWAYNDTAIKLYADTLFERVFDDGSPEDIVTAPTRLGSLQFEDGPLFTYKNGVPRLQTTPRDFARIGWLWANRGRWGDVQLVPAELHALTTTPVVPAGLPRTVGEPFDDYLGIGTAGGGPDQTGLGPGAYAFNWWLNPARSTWPSAPADTVQANGHWNGEVLTVIPSLGLVAAWRGAGTNSESFTAPMDPLLALLVDACTR